MKNTELYDITKLMHDVLVAVSTGKSYNDAEIVSNYQTSRKALMQNRSISNLLPDFVKKYRDLSAFWGFIKNEPGGYAERRRYLGEVFAPLFDYLEQRLRCSAALRPWVLKDSCMLCQLIIIE